MRKTVVILVVLSIFLVSAVAGAARPIRINFGYSDSVVEV